MISAFGVEHGDFSKSANKSINVFLGAGGTKARQLRFGNLNLAQVPRTRTTIQARQAQQMAPRDKKRVGAKTGRRWDLDMRETPVNKVPRKNTWGRRPPV